MAVKKKKNVYSIIGLLIIAMILSLYFYNQLTHIEIPIHSDDAGTAVDFRDIIEMGKARNIWLQPFSLINVLLYYVLGPTEFWLNLYFSVKYFICIAFSLILALRTNGETKWWIMPLFVFFCMPGCFGTASIHPLKFHVWTIAVPLICLAYLHFRGDDFHSLKKKDILIVMFLALYGIIERDILVCVTCWLPFTVYWGIYFVQKGYLKKYVSQIILCGAGVLLVGKAFFSMIQYEGYGASSFPAISALFDNLVIGTTGLLTMFNIDIIGNDVIQFKTLIWVLRLILLILSFWSLGMELKDIFRKGIENVSIVDALLAISGAVVIVVYLFGGAREGEISIRYAAYLYYILVILLCRKAIEKIDPANFEIKLGLRKINIISVFFVVAIIVFMDRVSFVRDINTKDILAQRMLEIEELENGMGSFWNANVISCLTDYQIEIQPGAYQNEKVEPFLQEWDAYRSGNKKYNFFIEDKENDHGIVEENLQKVYGDYVDKYSIEKSNIYVYDYDIRTAPLVITSDEFIYLSQNEDMKVSYNGDITLNSGQTMIIDRLYITSGKIRVIINGELKSGKINLSTGQGVGADRVKATFKQAVFEIPVSGLYESFELNVENNLSEKIKIKNIIIERLKNAVYLPNEKRQEVELTPGYYIFGLEGQGIKNSEMFFNINGKHVDSNRINNGRQKVTYGIKITEESVLEVAVNTKGIIKGMYYQNELRSTINNPECLYYDVNHGIRTHEDGTLLYGPYEELKAGEYVVDIYGENLDIAEIHFTTDCGVSQQPADLIDSSSGHLSFLIDSQEDMSAFEVTIRGIDNENLQVHYYTISSKK